MTRPLAVCMLDTPHRPHRWSSPGGMRDCPGVRPSPDRCLDVWHRSTDADGTRCPTCDDLAPADDNDWADNPEGDPR